MLVIARLVLICPEMVPAEVPVKGMGVVIVAWVPVVPTGVTLIGPAPAVWAKDEVVMPEAVVTETTLTPNLSAGRREPLLFWSTIWPVSLPAGSMVTTPVRGCPGPGVEVRVATPHLVSQVGPATTPAVLRVIGSVLEAGKVVTVEVCPAAKLVLVLALVVPVGRYSVRVPAMGAVSLIEVVLRVPEGDNAMVVED